MQKFSRAMIGAVLFLPVIGLILALSSVLTNPTLILKPVFTPAWADARRYFLAYLAIWITFLRRH
jgi:hypothetical protein